MGDGSHIEWTDASWNPLAGCSRVSPGCDLCYAARETAGRLSGLPLYAGLAERPEGGGPARFTGEIRTAPERLDQPLRWQRPRRVFVNSMSDLFHPGAIRAAAPLPVGRSVAPPYLAEVLAVMAAAPRHQFQVLTKRPQLAAGVLRLPLLRAETDAALLRRGLLPMPGGPGDEWPPNVWLGTSIESAAYRYRIRHLQKAPVVVRFLSLEPLLGPLGHLDLDGIAWVIVGGESGPGARPMHPEWAREIRDQCVDRGVPFFFKQWGEWEPCTSNEWAGRDGERYLPPGYEGAGTGTGAFVRRVGKRRAGRELDGRTWDEMPAQAVPA